jgi:hypothetical protein
MLGLVSIIGIAVTLIVTQIVTLPSIALESFLIAG